MAVVCHMDTSSLRIVARMSLEVCRHFGWRFISVTPCLIQLGIQRHTLWRRLGKHGGDFTNTAATLNIPPRTESVTPNKPRTQPLASTGGGGRQRTYQPNQPNNPTSTRARDLCNLLSSYERGHGLDTTLRLGNSALDVWSGGAHTHTNAKQAYHLQCATPHVRDIRKLNHPRGLGTCVTSFQVTKGDTGSTPRYGWVTLRRMSGVVEHTHTTESQPTRAMESLNKPH